MVQNRLVILFIIRGEKGLESVLYTFDGLNSFSNSIAQVLIIRGE